MPARVRKAVIPAAGRGTRFYPVTRSVPKELLPIVATSAIDWVIQEAVATGIEEVIVVSSPHKPGLAQHINANATTKMTIVLQETPLGLGHAVACARAAVGDEPFAVLLPDDIYEPPWPTSDLVDLYAAQGMSAVTLLEVTADDVSRYGVIAPSWEREGLIGISDLVEKPSKQAAPSRLTLAGRYLLEPEIFDILVYTPPGIGGEIQLTDALRVLASRGRLLGLRARGRRHDIGNPLGMILAQVAFGLRDSAVAPSLLTALRQLLAE